MSCYHEYKSCTNKFVQWIVDFAAVVDKSSKKWSQSLQSLKMRVKLITDQSMIVLESNGKLMEKLHETMLAGHRAIDLRKHVHSLLSSMGKLSAEHTAKNHSHRYCITTLEECYDGIHKWLKSQAQQNRPSPTPSVPASAEIDRSSFNMYSVLESLDEITSDDVEAASVTVLDEADAEKTIDEIDEAIGDLRITALCLYHDMKTSMNTIKKVWDDVRAEKKSILSAVASTIVAYRQICKLHSAMQLKYPSLVTSHDFYVCCIVERSNEKEMRALEESSFFQDQIEVTRLLSSLCSAFRDKINTNKTRDHLIYRRGFYGEPYLEKRNPLGTGFHELLRFLSAEFPELYNSFYNGFDQRLYNEATFNARYKFHPLTKLFYEAYIPHFQSGIVTLPEVFLTHSWIQAIQCLQNQENLFLGRSLYSLRKLGRHIDQAVKEFVEHPKLKEFYGSSLEIKTEPFLQRLLICTCRLPYGAVGEYTPLHNNPILQGCVVLDKLCNYLEFVSQEMQGLSSYYRSICHLYHGLQAEGIFAQLPPIGAKMIPVMDTFYQVYKAQVFVGGDPDTVTKGNYETQYLLSSNCTVLSIAAAKQTALHTTNTVEDQSYQPRAHASHASNKQDRVKQRQRIEPSNLSKIYRILIEQSYSDISADYYYSIPLFLQQVTQAMEDELYTTRYFTFNLTHYFFQFYEFFTFLRSKYPAVEKCYQTDMTEATAPHTKHLASLDLGVMKPCLFALDHYTVDKKASSSYMFLLSIAKDFYTFFMNPTEDLKVLMRKEITHMNDMYYFLPPTRRWLVEEFGSLSFSQSVTPTMQARASTLTDKYFKHLDTVFQEMEPILQIPSNQRTEEQKEQLLVHQVMWKRQLKVDAKSCPVMMMMIKEDSENLIASILDHATCGIWREDDHDFAEWLLVMWAHNFHEEIVHTHLHIAVLYRQAWALPLLICAYGGILIDYQCPVDGNTALHYASILGNESMVTTLTYAYANAQLRNQARKRPCDLLPSLSQQSNVFAKTFTTCTDRIHQERIEKERDQAAGGYIARSIAMTEKKAAQLSQSSNLLREEEKVHEPTAAEISKAGLAVFDEEDGGEEYHKPKAKKGKKKSRSKKKK